MEMFQVTLSNGFTATVLAASRKAAVKMANAALRQRIVENADMGPEQAATVSLLSQRIVKVAR